MAKKECWNLLSKGYDEVAEYLKTNDVIVIPMGSTEKHGAHCPLGTDAYTTIGVVEAAAPIAKTLHAPLMPIGYSPHHMGRVGEGTGTLTFSGNTFRSIVYDIAMSVIYHGFNKIIFVSHHGSNSKVIDDVLRQIRYETGCFVCWYKTPTERTYSLVGEIFEGTPEETLGWHASEVETSTAWAYNPDSVDMSKAVDDRTHAPRWMGDAFDKHDGSGMVTFLGAENIWVPMEHYEYSDTSTIGNPMKASIEKGQKYFKVAGEALAQFIEEVKKFDIVVPDEKRDFPNRA